MKSTFLQSFGRTALRLAAVTAVLVMGWLPAPVGAVIISSGQGNTTPPADDPGFYNVSDPGGGSFVYLGDSWVLTAFHAVRPNAVSFAGQAYDVLDHTEVRLHNPAGMDLTVQTDLRMFRINGNPDLPALNISSSSPPVGAEVVMIGVGRRRQDTLTNWDVTKNGDNWTWTETTGNGNYRGYRATSDGVRDKRWGTNVIVDANPILGEKDNHHSGIVEVFGGVNMRQIISLLTVFDETGGTLHEAQAMAGDSGGGVFYKRNGAWELAGIMNAVLTLPNQRSDWAVYGQATTFADLSFYRDEILAIMANPNYSILGDINLDGIVSGDGTGPPESDDLSAFMAGWLMTHPAANIDSWKLGDLNQDGITDLQDFKLLRQVHPSAASMATALGVAEGAVIPEPATWTIVVVGALAAWRVVRPARRGIPC